MHLRYDYHLSYEEAEEKLRIKWSSVRLSQEHLQWTGHMLRSEDDVLREALEFIPEGGARSRGRPRLRYYDTVKSDLLSSEVQITAKSQTQFWVELRELSASRLDWQKIVVKEMLG